MTLAVVHLVRQGNPARWLTGFLTTYGGLEAGIPHDLVVILKGVTEPAPLQTEVLAVDPGAAFLAIPDDGFDINAYRHAAEILPHDRLCFVNSHSRIEAADWLAALSAPLDDPAVGATAASASWEALDRTTPFPNPHLRTTGFAIRREAFLGLDFGPLATKRDCNRFEAGANSMSHQIRAQGQRILLCGRNGAHDPDAWPSARVFRSGLQEHLLISDNRTRAYDRAWPLKRRRIGRAAWGAEADIAARPLGSVIGGLIRGKR